MKLKLLFATDGSDCSHHALSEALRLLPLERYEIFVVAVGQPMVLNTDPTAYGVIVGPADVLAIDELLEAPRRHLAATRNLLAEHGLTATELERTGNVAAQILEAAEAIGADLLVLGAHGLGPVRRLFMGSVSHAVLQHWVGSVLIARQPPAAP